MSSRALHIFFLIALLSLAGGTLALAQSAPEDSNIVIVRTTSGGLMA